MYMYYIKWSIFFLSFKHICLFVGALQFKFCNIRKLLYFHTGILYYFNILKCWTRDLYSQPGYSYCNLRPFKFESWLKIVWLQNIVPLLHFLRQIMASKYRAYHIFYSYYIWRYKILWPQYIDSLFCYCYYREGSNYCHGVPYYFACVKLYAMSHISCAVGECSLLEQEIISCWINSVFFISLFALY